MRVAGWNNDIIVVVLRPPDLQKKRGTKLKMSNLLIDLTTNNNNSNDFFEAKEFNIVYLKKRMQLLIWITKRINWLNPNVGAWNRIGQEKNPEQ